MEVPLFVTFAKSKNPKLSNINFFLLKRKCLTYFIWYFIGLLLLLDGFHKVSILKKCIEIIQVFVQHELRIIQHAKNVYFVRTYGEKENYRLRNYNSKSVFKYGRNTHDITYIYCELNNNKYF